MVNAVITDNKHDQVELNHILHQSGQGGGRKAGTRASCRSQDGGGGSGLCDSSAAVYVARILLS